MIDKKMSRTFIIVTLLFKTAINFILPVFYLFDTFFVFAISYAFFNAFLIYEVATGDRHEVKKSLAASIIVDQVYALILNLLFISKLWQLIYFYPSTSMLYFVGTETFLKMDVILYIVAAFSVIFFAHSFYVVLENKSTFNFCFSGVYFLHILFMLFKLYSRKKHHA